MIRLSVYGINVILETDDPGTRYFLEFQTVEKRYNFWLKIWEDAKIKGKIWNRMKTNNGKTYFEIGIGFASYLLKVFGQDIPKEDYDDVLQAVCQSSYRTQPFRELRDYQNQDILHLLKYKFGIFSVFTGYGKTSIIACLTKYYLDLGKKVLLVTPQSKPRDELIKRIKNNYQIDVPTRLGTGSGVVGIITSGFLNRVEFKNDDKEGQKRIIEELEKFDVILVDELEYCINPAGKYIFGHAKNAEVRYGFSGTSDKKSAKLIGFSNGLADPVVTNNLDMIRYFGTSLVYKKPLDLTVNMVSVKSEALNADKLMLWEELDKDGDKGNTWVKIMSKILTNPGVSEVLVKVARRFKMPFIPVNNLQNIIYPWIDEHFKDKFRILLICGEGYVYYDLNGGREVLDLSQACVRVEEGKVDVIFSTAAGFRALDLPNLMNIILISGKIAGSVLQQVGRVARQKEFNVITLEPLTRKPLPIYTKTMKAQKEMIKEYYSYCKINEKEIKEDEL